MVLFHLMVVMITINTVVWIYNYICLVFIFLDIKKLRTLGTVYFTYLFLYSGLEFTLTFLTHNKFGYTSMQQGWMFFGIGVTMAILQGGWVRRIPPARTAKTATLVKI